MWLILYTTKYITVNFIGIFEFICIWNISEITDKKIYNKKKKKCN